MKKLFLSFAALVALMMTGCCMQGSQSVECQARETIESIEMPGFFDIFFSNFKERYGTTGESVLISEMRRKYDIPVDVERAPISASVSFAKMTEEEFRSYQKVLFSVINRAGGISEEMEILEVETGNVDTVWEMTKKDSKKAKKDLLEYIRKRQKLEDRLSKGLVKYRTPRDFYEAEILRINGIKFRDEKYGEYFDLINLLDRESQSDPIKINMDIIKSYKKIPRINNKTEEELLRESYRMLDCWGTMFGGACLKS